MSATKTLTPRRILTAFLSFVLASFLCVGIIPPQGIQQAYAAGAVGYVVGTTPISEGMAAGADDITVYNDQIAFSLAVSSNNYWSMTKGSILDIARIEDGVYGKDLVNDVEFLNDLWTATGTYDGQNLLTDIVVDNPVVDSDSVSITIHTRYWVADADKNGVADLDQFGELQKPLNVDLTYELAAGDNYITLETEVTNPSDNAVTYTTMYAGYSLSTLAANMYGPFGFYPDVKATGIAVGRDAAVEEYFGSYVATYGSDYAVMLYQDYVDSYKGSSGYKDIYDLQDYAPDASAEFSGRIVVSEDASTAGIMDTYAAFDSDLAANLVEISGTVTDDEGDPIANAYVIAKKQGVYMNTSTSGVLNGDPINEAVGRLQPLLWAVTDADGNYAMRLPSEDWTDPTGDILGNNASAYAFKVEAAGFTSYEDAETQSFATDTIVDFSLEAGAPVTLTAVDGDGNAIPFKVSISGLTSEIKTLGGGTYFSDSFNTDDPYGISINLSQAENVTFTASYGGGFESNTVSWTTDIGPEGVEHEFVLPTIIDPEDAGWYAVDNHQHSDYGDGSTRIEDLFNAQIAAKLDYALVSDHDALAHNAEMADFAANHEPPIPFLSNLEVSPGWGHWGLLGIPIDDTYDIDPSATTPQEIIEYGHDAGTVVIVHHPYSDYGFLNNQASVNGGTDVGWDGFDLLELQSTINLDGFADALADGADSISLSNLKGSIRDLGITNMDAMALASAFAFWNNGQEIYLSAGSDQHDAASSTLYPGIIREYALLEEPTVENYLTALTNGEAYVTMGPILQPKLETTLFGSTHEVVVGEQYVLRLDAGSVNGATEITLWANGTPVATQSVGAISNGALQTASFTVTPFVTGDEENVWYSFTATDAAGKIAVSNPLWFELTDTSATTNLDGQVFTLTPEHAPTKSLDVKGGSTLAGAEIILYDSKHTANQHFRFEYNEANGTYTIVAVVSGQVLDVYGASATSGAKVIQWPAKATNNLNQQWIVEPAIGEDGYIIVSALNPDLMLDVSGSSTANGTSLILWNRHERPNQVFTLTPPDSSLDGSSFAIHTIAGTTDRVLDIYGKGIKGGERLILWSPNSQANQIFSFDYDETTGFYIITAEHSGQVLDIYGGSVNAGASVIQWPTKTSGNIFNQRWTVEEVRGGFIIKSAITGYALTVNGGLNAAGANLVAQPYRGTATQIWDLEG